MAQVRMLSTDYVGTKVYFAQDRDFYIDGYIRYECTYVLTLPYKIKLLNALAMRNYITKEIKKIKLITLNYYMYWVA